MKRRAFRRSQGGESGHALIFALFVIILALTAGALIATTFQLRMNLVRQQEADLQVTALCDAALAMALAELEERASYSGTGGTVPFANGEIRVDVEKVSYRRVTVDVEGSYAGRRRAARADVQLQPTLLLDWQPIAPPDHTVPWWRQ